MLKLMFLWSVHLRDTAVVRLAKQLKQSGDFKTGDANMTVPGNSQTKSRQEAALSHTVLASGGLGAGVI